MRHPLHVAKAAASVDRLSGERFVLGVATGDRPIEFPAFSVDPDGHSSQSPEWIAQHSDGWMYYPRNLRFQEELIDQWRSLTLQFKPFSQSLYLDLMEDPNHPPEPIHLGFRIGRNPLMEFFESLKMIGVNHVILNLKYGHRPVTEVIDELGEEVLPHFPAFNHS